MRATVPLLGLLSGGSGPKAKKCNRDTQIQLIITCTKLFNLSEIEEEKHSYVPYLHSKSSCKTKKVLHSNLSSKNTESRTIFL